jgi:hypothetical protein
MPFSADLDASGGHSGRRRGPITGEIDAIYDYTDEEGTVLFQVLRYRPKAFRSRRADGHGGWLMSLAGTRRVLYHLPQVMAAECVLIVEGEKDVQTAERLGLPPGWAATCSPFGACQWRSDYSRQLAGKVVYICPDNDHAGREHLLQVALALNDQAEAVHVVSLPDGAKDLSDWVQHGADGDSLANLLTTAEPFSMPEERVDLVGGLRPLVDAAGDFAAIYDYTDAEGSTLFQVCRLQPKAFRTRRPDGHGGWHQGLGPVQPVLYRLPRLGGADTVLIVEGEKDVETGERLSLPPEWAVTCSPFGVCQWRDEYLAILAGKTVYLCCDNDPPGQDHLMQVGLSLLSHARQTLIVPLPADVKDLSEWVANGGDPVAFSALLNAAEPFPYPRDCSELIAAVEPLCAALATVQKLRGAVLTSEPEGSNGVDPVSEIGFLAEEVSQVLPGWIGTDATGAAAVCIRGFEALATGALQELAAELRDLKEQLEVLNVKLLRLEEVEGIDPDIFATGEVPAEGTGGGTDLYWSETLGTTEQKEFR